ncbi:MAG: hypothetical protein OXC81_00655, partial [Betaproteobacteria bacterium]|nr:hypothetical protein [Betaproteobacteria bacterium]
MRTKENALSLWKCRSDREDCIEQAALAIAAAGDYIDRVHLVLIPEQHLMDNASLRATRGRTPYRSFSRQHCDLTDLDG